jgi:hypothetical protein
MTDGVEPLIFASPSLNFCGDICACQRAERIVSSVPQFQPLYDPSGILFRSFCALCIVS